MLMRKETLAVRGATIIGIGSTIPMDPRILLGYRYIHDDEDDENEEPSFLVQIIAYLIVLLILIIVVPAVLSLLSKLR
jgi:hypothetical protein